MIIAAIVATDLKNAIGKENQLLWHLPADLKFFKATTMGCPVIMGRKTYESIGRLLPGRKNIIVSRDTQYKVAGAEVFNSLDKAFKASKTEEKVFIIGGAEIYTQAMPHVQEFYRTLVKHEFDADTFFPRIDHDLFNLVWQECHEVNENNTYGFCFQKYERIK